jgi:hypothetical protein
MVTGSRVARATAPVPHTRASPLASQLRLLIASGGDERLWLDPASRRNRYGVPAAPAPDELWFSSSTACAISPRGWGAAATALERLTGPRATPINAWFDDLRARLLALYGAPGAEAILCASGTEAELVTLTLARGLAESSRCGPIVNIVVAPAETGSGIPMAAAARHFLGRASLGGAVGKGEQLSGWTAGDVSVATIEIREADGRPRAAAAVDREAALAVARATDAGAFAILHVLDASKTGRQGVSRAAAVDILARHQGCVLVVVDACQLRCEAEAIRADLAAGLTVMVTGSKFAGGPAFCGALLVPAELVGALADARPDASPLAPYSAALDWPAALAGRFRAPLPQPANLGLALRWAAALAEIETFEAIDPSVRRALVAAFDRSVRERIAADPNLSLLDAEGGAPGLIAAVHADGSDPRPVYEALQRGDAGRPCHLGQPVAAGERVALRVCASMPMIAAASDGGLAALDADLDETFAAWRWLRERAAG